MKELIFVKSGAGRTSTTDGKYIIRGCRQDYAVYKYEPNPLCLIIPPLASDFVSIKDACQFIADEYYGGVHYKIHVQRDD
jgi:hypothetical protein